MFCGNILAPTSSQDILNTHKMNSRRYEACIFASLLDFCDQISRCSQLACDSADSLLKRF